MAEPNNDEKSFLTVTRHEEYYITSADLSIMVDHIQFKVHRYFFERESKYFSSRLALPTATSPGSPLQGSDDSNSIILENVTPDQFARFLWVFYNPKHSIYDAPLEEWESILILATRWLFPEVKNLAIRELEKKDMLDVQRIKLYHDNNVDRNILVPRYAALIERERSLTADEGRDLGFETAMMIAAAREEARSSRLPSGMRSPLSPTIHGADLHEVIRELFKIAPGGSEAEVETIHTTGALKKPSLAPMVTQMAPQQEQARKQQTPKTQTPTTRKAKAGATVPTPIKTTPPKPPAPTQTESMNLPMPQAEERAGVKAATKNEESGVVAEGERTAESAGRLDTSMGGTVADSPLLDLSLPSLSSPVSSAV